MTTKKDAMDKLKYVMNDIDDYLTALDDNTPTWDFDDYDNLSSIFDNLTVVKSYLEFNK